MYIYVYLTALFDQSADHSRCGVCWLLYDYVVSVFITDAKLLLKRHMKRHNTTC